MTGRYLRVRDLLHSPGVRHRETGAFALEPVGTTAAQVADDAEVAYDLVLEAQGARVSALGNAHSRWVGPCRRCLEPTGGALDARIDEFFEASPLTDETWPIDDGTIDLEPVLREAMLLELPLVPLCRADCPGPDPERYPTAPVTGSDEAPAPDPRWAALEGLRIEEP